MRVSSSCVPGARGRKTALYLDPCGLEGCGQAIDSFMAGEAAPILQSVM